MARLVGARASVGLAINRRPRAILRRRGGVDTPPEPISDQNYSLPFLPHYFQKDYYWTAIKAYTDPIGNQAFSTIVALMRPRRYEQARVMGGGSTVNGQIAIRVLPSDCDEWEALETRAGPISGDWPKGDGGGRCPGTRGLRPRQRNGGP